MSLYQILVIKSMTDGCASKDADTLEADKLNYSIPNTGGTKPHFV